jgi:hypothetical protein
MDQSASTEISRETQPTSSEEANLELSLPRPSSYSLPPRGPSFSRGNTLAGLPAVAGTKASSSELSSHSGLAADGVSVSLLPEGAVMPPLILPVPSEFPALKGGPIFQHLYRLHQDRLLKLQGGQSNVFLRQQSAASLTLIGSHEEAVQSRKCPVSQSTSYDHSQADCSHDLSSGRDVVRLCVSSICLPECSSAQFGSVSPTPAPLPHMPCHQEGFGAKPWATISGSLPLPSTLQA